MAEAVPIDLDWLAGHPLPVHPSDTDKDERGHVVLVGGSRAVPGGLRLTGEAVLRSGAGRLQFATIEGLAIPLGLAVPEAGVIALPESTDGEIAGELLPRLAKSLARCDCVIVGPAMARGEAAAPVVHALLEAAPEGVHLVIDAAAIAAAGKATELLARFGARAVLTPNSGEMAGLLGRGAEDVADEPERAVREAVERFGSTVVLKGARSVIGAPGRDPLTYSGGSIGLATGGSGDVLAGILGGLIARGAPVADACAWAVWLHGEAGRRLTEQVGPVGFLARELVDLIPQLIRARR